MYLVLAVLVAMVPAILARSRGRRVRVVMLAFALATIGALVVGFGLLALMFHGYVEDYGSEPADTLDKAIAGLAIGAACSLAAWYVALHRPKDS
jgi:hypothetical protein